MKKLILSIIILTTVKLNAQYPLAPEVWSIPEKVIAISEWQVRSESPSISFDKQKLYFDGIAFTEWADTGWAEPTFLPSHINQHLARWPTISPNGKRIFFSWFYLSGWDLYYSDWDSTVNDWGVAVNCGPGVNTPENAEFSAALPNDTTLIFLRGTQSRISYWNNETQTWGPAVGWPTPTLLFASDYGIYVTPDFKKVYDTGTRSDTTIGGQSYLNYDINVSYKDTSNPRGYTIPYILNFCLYADTQYFAGNYVDRLEGFPMLTTDGKKMYLMATYDGQTTIYESIMLIDENGNPVNVEREKEGIIPQKIELLPAYPNPFNPMTKIKYRIHKSTDIRVSLYDMLGQKIADLADSAKNEGEYEITIDAKELKLSSGTYIVSLRTKEQQLAQKIIYIK
ncbi:MAG TPA: T9SS type A sorting domain-containing protein [Ignavibacteriaceae bacterium]|nr:T9SS type A sorting domain-containing protein [Ignavibacteriaceae bacterium]